MSRLALGLGLALLLLVSLSMSAPARLLALLLPDQQVHMAGFTGTIWRGTASRCLVRAGGGYLHLGAIQWRLSPLSLVTLSPRLTVSSEWGRQRVAGDVVLRGEGDFDLHDFEATLEADLVRQFAPVSLAGTLNALFAELVVRDGLPLTGRGRLVWQDGAWDSPQGFLALGSYALEVAPLSGGGLGGEVLPLAGPVAAQGSVELQGKAYVVDILVGGSGALDPQIERALSLIAAPEAGSYRVALEGEFQG